LAAGIDLREAANRDDRIHAFPIADHCEGGMGGFFSAVSRVRPGRTSIGTLARANRKVAGTNPQSFEPAQKVVLVLRQTISLAIARKKKKMIQLRVSSRQPRSESPG